MEGTNPVCSVFWDVVWAVLAQEVEAELCVGKVQLLKQCEAQDAGVEVQGSLGLFDAVPEKQELWLWSWSQLPANPQENVSAAMVGKHSLA